MLYQPLVASGAVQLANEALHQQVSLGAHVLQRLSGASRANVHSQDVASLQRKCSPIWFFIAIHALEKCDAFIVQDWFLFQSMTLIYCRFEHGAKCHENHIGEHVSLVGRANEKCKFVGSALSKDCWVTRSVFISV